MMDLNEVLENALAKKLVELVDGPLQLWLLHYMQSEEGGKQFNEACVAVAKKVLDEWTLRRIVEARLHEAGVLKDMIAKRVDEMLVSHVATVVDAAVCDTLTQMVRSAARQEGANVAERVGAIVSARVGDVLAKVGQ